MKKLSFILILLTLVQVAWAQKNGRTSSDVVRIIENPDFTSLFTYGLEIRKVEFGKKQTTLYFDFSHCTSTTFRFLPSTYLVDEEGRRYPIKSCEGFKLGEVHKVGKEGVMEMSISFEPLPEKTRVFDCIEGPDLQQTYQFYGIREKGQDWDVFPKKEVADNPFKDSYFRVDTVFVTGRITKSKYNRWGRININYNSYAEQSLLKLYRENHASWDDFYVEKDGTFSFKSIVVKPTMDWFNINGNCFYALLIPGDHLHVEISHLNEWNQQVTFKSELGDYSRMLVNNPFVYEPEIARPDLHLAWSETGKLAADTWEPLHKEQNQRLEVCRYLAAKYHFTPTEQKLLQMNVQTNNALISVMRMTSPVHIKYRKMMDAYYKSADHHNDINKILKRFTTNEIENDSIHLDFSFLKECAWDDPTISATPMYEVLVSKLRFFCDYIQFHPDGADRSSMTSDSINTYAFAKEFGIGEPIIAQRIADKFNSQNVPNNHDKVKTGEKLVEQLKWPHAKILADVGLHAEYKYGVMNYPVSQTVAAKAIKKLVAPYKDKNVILMPVSYYHPNALREVDSLYWANREEMDKEAVFLPIATTKITSKKALKEMQQEYPILKKTVYVSEEDLHRIYNAFRLAEMRANTRNAEHVILPDGTYDTSSQAFFDKYRKKK